MKRFVWIIWTCTGPLLFADLGLIDSTGAKFSIYRYGQTKKDRMSGTVTMVGCPRNEGQLTRVKCRTAPVATISFLEFVRNLHSLEAIPEAYRGGNSLPQVFLTLEKIERRLKNTTLPSEEVKRLEKKQAELTQLQKKLIGYVTNVFKKLEEDNDDTLDIPADVRPWGGDEIVTINALFDTIWFDEPAQLVYRLYRTQGTYQQAIKVCSGGGFFIGYYNPPQKLIPEFQRRLLASPLASVSTFWARTHGYSSDGPLMIPLNMADWQAVDPLDQSTTRYRGRQDAFSGSMHSILCARHVKTDGQ